MSASDRPVLVVVSGGLTGQVPSLHAFEELIDVHIVDSTTQLVRHAPEADALFIWDYRFAGLAPLLSGFNKLRWIHVAAVGVEAVLSPELRASSIVLTNSRGAFDIAIAEYVSLLMLADVKDLRNTLALQERRHWDHRYTRMLAGSHATVVGTGSIGRAIASMLTSLAVTVTLVGRIGAADAEFGDIIPSSDLAEIVRGTNYLVLAAPLTSQTRQLVDAEVLRALGPDGYLINIGRGGLIDTPSLVAVLANRTIRGAALDTFDTEPLPSSSSLWDLPNVVISPHMSGDYEGSADALLEIFRTNLLRFVQGQDLLNVVDYHRGYVVASER